MTATRPVPSNLVLDTGAHPNAEAGMCFMEAVTFVVGEDWSDAPKCVSPVIRAFGIRLNDRWPADARQRLVPFITRVIGTNTGRKDDKVRAFMALDWSLRTATPLALRSAGLEEHAIALEQLAPITSTADVKAARSVINAARDAAWEKRNALWAELRRRREAAAAVAVAAAEAAAAAVEAAVAAVAAIRLALSADMLTHASDERSAIVQGIVKTALESLPANASYFQIRDAVYWPVRKALRELPPSPTVAPLIEQLRAGALDLLERMIAVGKVPA